MPLGDCLHFLRGAMQDDALALRRVASFVDEQVRRQAGSMRALRAAESERRSENETEKNAGDTPRPQATSLTMAHWAHSKKRVEYSRVPRAMTLPLEGRRE